jgi:peptide/nickel transport system substrate-binding protein
MRFGLVCAFVVSFVGFSCLCGVASVSAATLRWASDGDVISMDPYARQDIFLLMFMQNIYEPLIRRTKDFQLEPSLATAWAQSAPDVWRFKLRQGVMFSDGTPFSADDVTFSFQRASRLGSPFASMFANVADVVKVDAQTVDVHTKGPDPILPQELTNWGIMSKAWCVANNATVPADLGKATAENFATRNAMGTGPYMLQERVPDVRTVLVANPTWWDKPTGNVTKAIFNRVANPATRVAGLLSGELDFLYAVPPQDIDRIATTPGTKILTKPELRTIILGFDQKRPELVESNIKGRNPFKDVRVREAVYRAIDEGAIVTKIMRGFAKETALIVGPGINGFDESLNARVPYDPAMSKRLLAEAGYSEGFETGMDCPNDRYMNDAGICEAVAAMLSKIGIRVDLLSQSSLQYMSKVGLPNFDTSFYLVGWTATTYDALNPLIGLVGTRVPGGSIGTLNAGGISNPQIDADILAVQGEIDPSKRKALLSDALGIVKKDFLYVPLHQQVLVWASRSNVAVTQMPDDFFPLRFATVN